MNSQSNQGYQPNYQDYCQIAQPNDPQSEFQRYQYSQPQIIQNNEMVNFS